MTFDALLTDARLRPSWARLVRACAGWQAQVEQDREGLAGLMEELPEDLAEEASFRARAQNALTAGAEQAARQRAAQLVGMVAPRGLDKTERAALMNIFVTAARAEAIQQAGRRGGRERRPMVPAFDLPELNTPLPFQINQAQRWEINAVAQAIAERRFLRPRDTVALADDPYRAARAEIARAAIRMTAQSLGASTMTASTPSQPKRHATAQQARESARKSYSEALEACRLLWLNDPAARHTAGMALAHRAAYLAATSHLERDAKRSSTGRYLDGDILSVRTWRERLEGSDEPAAFRQEYARLVIVWAADGVSLLVANREQLERSSGVDVGESGWRDFERWVFDTLQKAEGRQPGRRAEDDTRLIYRRRVESSTRSDRDHDDAMRLRLRRVIDEKYPGLVRALEAIRRSLGMGDISPAELPEYATAPGLHFLEDQPDQDDEMVEEEDQWRDLRERARSATSRKKLGA